MEEYERFVELTPRGSRLRSRMRIATTSFACELDVQQSLDGTNWVSCCAPAVMCTPLAVEVVAGQSNTDGSLRVCVAAQSRDGGLIQHAFTIPA